MPGLKDAITEDFWMTPEDFKTRYRAMHGTGFSIALCFQSAWFRYHNRDPQSRIIAAGAHPGAGCLVLCSAKVVEALVAEDERQHRAALMTRPSLHRNGHGGRND